VHAPARALSGRSCASMVLTRIACAAV
jgi:hypothetical protein